MAGAIAPFNERYRRALADQRLRNNLLTFQRSWRQTRETAFSHLSDPFDNVREQLVTAKNTVLEEPVRYQRQFVEQATGAGAHVHQAATAEEARELILRLLSERDVKLLAKGKSMLAEEIFLNEHLERNAIRVVETDLGEWVIQLAHETPSHMVMPAIHKSRVQVADLLEAEAQRPVDHEDIGSMVSLARAELRRAFLAADAGLIGANALIAETGSVMLVTNEGNGDLVSTLPRLLIVIAGFEKLLPRLSDAAAQLRLLARSATSQDITTYTSFITGAEPEHELHLVIVDNGRSAMHADPEFRDALRCIRCAACADICPPYQVVGGHVFGYVYSGAIGLVNTGFHHGVDAVAGPQALCVSCNACATVCPVEIPLPRLILEARARVAASRQVPATKRAVLGLFQYPRVFDALARVGAALQPPTVPVPRRWAWRKPPRLAKRPARDALLGRTFEPLTSGPWVNSGARGKTVAYFIQCVTDRFAPEQALAAVRVLQACGARVIVPAGQHCCGLPHIDSGDVGGARHLAQVTIAALESIPADYVVTAAASCAIAISHDYPRLLGDDRAGALAERTYDLVSFLDRVASPRQLAPIEGGPSVTYHSFCQSTNVLGIASVGPKLLRLAGIEPVELPEATVCCGFGGATSIEYPEVGQGIAARKLENVRASGALVLCTDNPGCLLHLRGAAQAASDPFEVRHIVELLADRLAAP